MTITAQRSSQTVPLDASKDSAPCPSLPPTGQRPNLKICRIGLVSRNYWDKLPRKFDFSGVLREVLDLLDKDAHKCDMVLFSLWSIIWPFSVKKHLSAMNPRHIKAVLYEEFRLKENISKKDIPKRKKFPAKPGGSRFVVCYRNNGAWHEYKFKGVFASLNPGKRDREEAKAAGWKVEDWMDAKAKCLISRLPERVLGNCCVIVCGESNIVRRRRPDKEWEVHDESHIKKAMPKNVRIVLNPGHDRMGPRMNLKRKFLSKAPGRWVLCVWNKDKRGKHRNERDGKKPAWMAFCNGQEETETIKPLKDLPKELQGVKVGVAFCG